MMRHYNVSCHDSIKSSAGKHVYTEINPNLHFTYRKEISTVNQLIFATIIFTIFFHHEHFRCNLFCGLQNWTMKEHCPVCLHRHFCYNLFSRISLSSENEWFTKIIWFTVLELPLTIYDFMEYLMLKTL